MLIGLAVAFIIGSYWMEGREAAKKQTELEEALDSTPDGRQALELFEHAVSRALKRLGRKSITMTFNRP
jgi:hypothetical protein